MIEIAIALLWVVFGAVVLGGVVWLVLYGINKYVYPVPEQLRGGIMFLLLILVLIAMLYAVSGGGSMRFPSFR